LAANSTKVGAKLWNAKSSADGRADGLGHWSDETAEPPLGGQLLRQRVGRDQVPRNKVRLLAEGAAYRLDQLWEDLSPC